MLVTVTDLLVFVSRCVSVFGLVNHYIIFSTNFCSFYPYLSYSEAKKCLMNSNKTSKHLTVFTAIKLITADKTVGYYTINNNNNSLFTKNIQYLYTINKFHTIQYIFTNI